MATGLKLVDTRRGTRKDSLGVEMVAFAINTRHPVRVDFCGRVRNAWLKNGRLALRRRRGTIHFRTRGPVETSLGPASPDLLLEAAWFRVP